MNNIILIGRLTKDPEAKMLQSGKEVSTINIAVDRNYKDKDGNKVTDFFMCDIFGKAAEFTNKYISKGRLVAIQGEVHIDKYQDKEGNKRSITKISVSNIKALDRKEDKPQEDAPQGFSAIDSDDIPF